jgi:hypothetical protein
MVMESGKKLSELGPKRLDELWQISKKNTRKHPEQRTKDLNEF